MKSLCKKMKDHVGITCMVLCVILVLTMILATGIGPVSIPFTFLGSPGQISDSQWM